MRLINYIAKNLSKRDLLQHSQKRCFSTKFSRFIPNKENPHCQTGSHCFYRRTRVLQSPDYSIFYPFIRTSGYSTSSSLKNQKMGLLSWYLSMLDSRPILTKSISASLIYAAADITSQMITMPSSGSPDFTRTLRMAGYGLLILGVSQHMWFNFIARMLPKRDVVTTLKKIVVGQLVFGPTITSIFFSFNAALQGERMDDIAGRLKRDLLPTLLSGLLFWPLCDFFTYKIIPVHLQPLINSSFSYIWTIYLTYMASLQKAAAD